MFVHIFNTDAAYLGSVSACEPGARAEVRLAFICDPVLCGLCENLLSLSPVTSTRSSQAPLATALAPARTRTLPK